MKINRKSMTGKQEGIIIFCVFYHSRNCLANVFSFGNAIDYQYHVGTYDQLLVQVIEGEIDYNAYILSLNADVSKKINRITKHT